MWALGTRWEVTLINDADRSRRYGTPCIVPSSPLLEINAPLVTTSFRGIHICNAAVPGYLGRLRLRQDLMWALQC
jgi:hypothetical protein